MKIWPRTIPLKDEVQPENFGTRDHLYKRLNTGQGAGKPV